MSGPVFRRVGESIRQTRKRAREMDGNRFVSVKLTCPAGHAGDRVAAEVCVPTQDGTRPGMTFDDAWPGHWLPGDQIERTALLEAPDGHRTVEAQCPTCGRLLQIREDRLRALLAGLWEPGAWRSRSWPPA